MKQMTKQEYLENEIIELKRMGKKLFGNWSTYEVDKLITLDLSVLDSEKIKKQ